MDYSGKRKYVLQHWKGLVTKSVSLFAQWAVMIITLTGSLFGCLPEEKAGWLHHGVRYLLANPVWVVFLLVLILLAALLYCWPKTRAVYKDRHSDITVIIECCDILRESGMKVIHVVDTFDMALGTIISPRSLHGAFLQLCQRQQIDVDAQVDAALAHLRPIGTNDELPGRKAQYDLGTTIRVDVGDEPFCCVAFTRLQPSGTISITKEDYIRCLKQVWRNLADPLVRSDEVNVAVMGNKFVDLPAEFSTEQKIDLMLQTFFAVMREKRCCRTLRICVHPDNATEIDFDKYPVIIDHLAKRPVI